MISVLIILLNALLVCLHLIIPVVIHLIFVKKSVLCTLFYAELPCSLSLLFLLLIVFWLLLLFVFFFFVFFFVCVCVCVCVCLT